MADKSKFLSVFAVALAVLSLCRSASGAPSSKFPVNLLFILSDQFRHDVMSCAGHPVVQTPNLDRLAREGTRFEKAYSQCPVCAPARATLLSGRSIYNHGIIKNTVVNEAAAQKTGARVFPMKTFDEILCAQGYRCEYHGKWHVPAYRGECYIGFSARGTKHMFSPGYDEVLKSSGVPDHLPAGNDIRKCPALGAPGVLLPYRPNPLDPSYGLAAGGRAQGKGRMANAQPDYHGELLIGARYSITAFDAGLAIRSIRELSGAPFSITCSFNWPHAPMLPTAPYAGMYPAREMKPPASIGDPMLNSPYPSANGRQGHPEYRDPEKIKFMMSDYYGLIKEIDDWVGKILDTLRETGAEGNTLVVFTSDHGEMLGAHGMREKNVFYEESVRVPLLLRLPGGIPAGRVIAEPVSQIDVFSTILDYLDAGSHESDGQSLRAIIEEKDAGGRCIVSEWADDAVPGFMVRSGDWKFLFGRTAAAPALDALYNLKDDPSEMKNLLGRNPEREKYRAQAETMKQQLIGWLARVRSPYLAEVASRPALASAPVSEGLPEIAVLLEAEPVQRGIRFIQSNAVTENLAVERGGRQGWTTVRKDGGHPVRYVYFDVVHPPLTEGRAPACEISLEYFDQGDADVRVAYDSSDARVLVTPKAPGAWKAAGKFHAGNSGQWKAVSFKVADAFFGGRLNGHDVRVEVLGNRDIVLGALRIRQNCGATGTAKSDF